MGSSTNCLVPCKSSEANPIRIDFTVFQLIYPYFPTIFINQLLRNIYSTHLDLMLFSGMILLEFTIYITVISISFIHLDSVLAQK